MYIKLNNQLEKREKKLDMIAVTSNSTKTVDVMHNIVSSNCKTHFFFIKFTLKLRFCDGNI